MIVTTKAASRAAGEVLSGDVGGPSAAVSGHLIWPASADRTEATPLTRWLPEVRRRVEELSYAPDGWDGYFGSPLSPVAVDTLFSLLRQYAQFIQSAPLVMLSPDGGLVVRWDQTEYLLEVESTPNSEVEVHFSAEGHEEFEGPVEEAPELNKWLWQASNALYLMHS